MRPVYEYSHLGGAEILHVRYPAQEREIYEAIAEVTASRTKVSAEKTMRGRTLYSPTDMNQQFHRAFAARGYAEQRNNFAEALKPIDNRQSKIGNRQSSIEKNPV